MESRLNVTSTEGYLDTKWHLDPYSRLATTDVGRKLGEGVVRLWGSWVSI